jgi:uncharacterized RDD family membrane protein YckC
MSPVEAGPMDLDPADTAGFWVRAGARTIDLVAVTVIGGVGGVLGAVVNGILAALHLVRPDWIASAGKLTVTGFALGLLASLGYHAFSEGIGGASVGKLVLGLRVKRVDLRPAGVAAGIIRNLAYYIDAFFFGVIAYSAMQKSRLNQRVGDGWAHTVVVRAEKLPPGARGGVGLGLGAGIAAAIGFTILSAVVKAI